jgi:hypothetical protein
MSQAIQTAIASSSIRPKAASRDLLHQSLPTPSAEEMLRRRYRSPVLGRAKRQTTASEAPVSTSSSRCSAAEPSPNASLASSIRPKPACRGLLHQSLTTPGAEEMLRIRDRSRYPRVPEEHDDGLGSAGEHLVEPL